MELERMSRVNRRHKCPCCESTSWCLYTADRALCMRSPNDHPVTMKDGSVAYLHFLDRPLPDYKPPPKLPEAPAVDWEQWHRRCLGKTADHQLASLSIKLGVSSESLLRVGFAWSMEDRAWAIPMYSKDDVCGIRLRAEDGSKWARTGSHSGLFLADAGVPDLADTICIVEGPTDLAALLDLGLIGIGRPACRGLEHETAELCRGRSAIVMADCDEAKVRPDGDKWYPGQEGANALCKVLRGKVRSLKLIYPMGKAKDIRAWKQAGLTKSVFISIVRNTGQWKA